jgi:choline dehydrogenase-like flavoprotein
LGGSSAINMGMVVYPSKVGIDAWEILGNPGWGWEGLSPYIRKFHKAAAPSDEVRQFFQGMKHDLQDQGVDGPVRVSFGDQYMPYHGAWLKTFKALGYPQVEDPIKGSGIGPFVNPGAIDPITHTRSHAGAAYFGDSIQRRPNLRVITGALVEKLIFEKGGDLVVATAVQVRKDGNTYKIPVKKEVILAAGATHTPHVLELSGIGNADLLRSHGIEPVINNPGVGENLQDHGYVSFSYEVADGLPSGDMAQDPAVAAAAMAAYQKDGSGPLGMVGLVSAFMPCLDFPLDERAQLLQMLDIHSGGEISPGQKKQFDALRQILQDSNEPTAQYILSPFQVLPREAPSTKGVFGLAHGRHPGFFISIGSLLSYPFSRGSVHLESNDPKGSPIIDSGILRHPIDLELQARHSIWMEKIAETEPMASLLKTGGARLHTTERLTDVAKAKELCKELSLSIFHLSGTCAMLPREDGGVLDSKLKVYGTSNVRVIDASLFPLEPRGNLQATVFAVAEKAADIIKQNA